MEPSSQLEELSLAGLAHRCAQESERFFHRQEHDPRFCLEIFRRAILGRDTRAWELIYLQYHALVSGWVNRHPVFPSADEEAQYFVNRAFEKMWVALTPEKFKHFPDLKFVLRYLQMCVHSVLVDHARLAEQVNLDVPLETLETGQSDLGPEGVASARAQREALWKWLEDHLRDEKERQVMYGSFVLDLKPRELHATFPGVFHSVEEVYRVKQNVLDRLRRDPALQTFMSDA